MKSLIIVILSLIALWFIAAIMVGAYNMIDNNEQIRQNCVKTTLVVIGNKGHSTPVYNCKDIIK